MEIGIFPTVFARPSLGATLDAVANHGFRVVQFDLASAGMASMPDQVDATAIRAVRGELDARGIRVAALSGTFNMAHPDRQERQKGLERLRVLAATCHPLGAPIITLCTGTRDRDSMWRRHPDNDAPDAWDDLLETIAVAVEIAATNQVTLALEPEVSNVVDSAAKARRLLDTIGSPWLKVVIDGANLFHAGELPHMRVILDEAFTLLKNDIVLAHAKDLRRDGEAGHDAAGTGVLDYDRYVTLMGEIGYAGPLILHSLTEDQVGASVAFLAARGARLGAPPA